MNDQLTCAELESIAAVLEPGNDAPRELKERAMFALAHDASERALEILRFVGPRMTGDLKLFWELAIAECSSFHTGPRLEAIVSELGPLLDLPPCEQSEEQLEELHEALCGAFDARGIGFLFEDEEPLGRRVAVMRAVFEGIGDLCFERYGHHTIDMYYAPEAELLSERVRSESPSDL